MARCSGCSRWAEARPADIGIEKASWPLGACANWAAEKRRTCCSRPCSSATSSSHRASPVGCRGGGGGCGGGAPGADEGMASDTRTVTAEGLDT